MCQLWPDARSWAKLGQKKLGEAGPTTLASVGFWPGLWFAKAKAGGLSRGFWVTNKCPFRHYVEPKLRLDRLNFAPKITTLI